MRTTQTVRHQPKRTSNPLFVRCLHARLGYPSCIFHLVARAFASHLRPRLSFGALKLQLQLGGAPLLRRHLPARFPTEKHLLRAVADAARAPAPATLVLIHCGLLLVDIELLVQVHNLLLQAVHLALQASALGGADGTCARAESADGSSRAGAWRCRSVALPGGPGPVREGEEGRLERRPFCNSRETRCSATSCFRSASHRHRGASGSGARAGVYATQ